MFIVQEAYIVIDEKNWSKVIEWFDTLEEAERFANEINEETCPIGVSLNISCETQERRSKK